MTILTGNFFDGQMAKPNNILTKPLASAGNPADSAAGQSFGQSLGQALGQSLGANSIEAAQRLPFQPMDGQQAIGDAPQNLRDKPLPSAAGFAELFARHQQKQIGPIEGASEALSIDMPKRSLPDSIALATEALTAQRPIEAQRQFNGQFGAKTGIENHHPAQIPSQFGVAAENILPMDGEHRDHIGALSAAKAEIEIDKISNQMARFAIGSNGLADLDTASIGKALPIEALAIGAAPVEAAPAKTMVVEALPVDHGATQTISNAGDMLTNNILANNVLADKNINIASKDGLRDPVIDAVAANHIAPVNWPAPSDTARAAIVTAKQNDPLNPASGISVNANPPMAQISNEQLAALPASDIAADFDYRQRMTGKANIIRSGDMDLGKAEPKETPIIGTDSGKTEMLSAKTVFAEPLAAEMVSIKDGKIKPEAFDGGNILPPKIAPSTSALANSASSSIEMAGNIATSGQQNIAAANPANPASLQPIDFDENFARNIGKRIIALAPAANGRVKLQISPAHLGRIEIEIIGSEAPEQPQQMRLVTENEQVRQMLIGAQTKLEQELRQNGSKAPEINIELKQNTQQNGQENPQSQTRNGDNMAENRRHEGQHNLRRNGQGTAGQQHDPDQMASQGRKNENNGSAIRYA